MTEATGTTELRPLQVEMNGINIIAENERKGHPRDLFWPWFAANISVLGLSYGAFVLDFGISFWQAVAVGVAGIVLSFLACGFIAVAGKRGSAPTMVLSRAAFGVNGNKLPTVISWLLTVGWETVLVILATLATATVFHQLGWGGGTGTKVVALIIVVGLTIFGGVMGFDLIMRMQTLITIVTGVATVVFIALVADHIHWHTVSGIHSGSAEAVIGALVFVMTGFGLGWVNVAADYSRYLPRRSSGAGVVWWTTFASSIAPVFLLSIAQSFSCWRGPSVAILRQFRPALASAAQAELVHFAVKRRAGHVEVLGGFERCRRNGRARVAERPARPPRSDRFPPAPTNQIGGRHRPCELLHADAERQPRGPRRANDEIAVVDRDERDARALAGGRQHDPRRRKSMTEVLRFDRARRIRDCGRDQPDKAFGEVGAARGNVERRGQLAVLVVDRRGRAAQECVAREEMLVAVDGQETLLDEAGPNAVGALDLLAPHGAGP